MSNNKSKNIIKTIRQDFVITKKDLFKLFDYGDSINKNEIYTVVNAIYKGVALFTFLTLISRFILFIIIIKTSGLNLHKIDSIPAYLLNLLIALLVVTIFRNLLMNYNVFIKSQILVQKYLPKFKKEFKYQFDDKSSKEYSEFYSTLLEYYFNAIDLFDSSLKLLVTIASTFFININKSTLQYFIFFSILIIFLSAISGYIYIKNSLLIRNKLLANKKIDKKIVFKRVTAPLTSNLLNQVVFPVAIIGLVTFGLNNIIVQVSLLASLASFTWNIIMNIEKFKIAKTSLTKITKTIKKKSKKFVINNECYYKQCRYTKTNSQLINKSRENKSLILKDYIPMGITNKKITNRKYNFEFFPGVYQLNGLNGVGKTTLLKSIGLQKETNVEYSFGQAAFCGKPLFDNKLSLKKHRNKVIYLNKEIIINKKIKKVSVKNIKKHRQLYKFVQTLNKRHSNTYSEGESAIFNIVNALEKMNNGQILIIDELLSGIYEDNEIKLRTSIIDMMLRHVQKTKSIVIIVDHVTKIENAKQLILKKPATIKIKS